MSSCPSFHHPPEIVGQLEVCGFTKSFISANGLTSFASGWLLCRGLNQASQPHERRTTSRVGKRVSGSTAPV